MFTLTDPLYQTSAYPGVTFYDEPQKREFPSTGGHVDFNNGVEVTVPSNAVLPESTVEITVQPCFAPSDVFVMPKGIQSASPSYLISCYSSTGLNREVTVTIEHHVRDSTREEIVFLQADPTPGEEGVYKYWEVDKSVFTPSEYKGRLDIGQWSAKLLKIGLKFITGLFGSERIAGLHDCLIRKSLIT